MEDDGGEAIVCVANANLAFPFDAAVAALSLIAVCVVSNRWLTAAELSITDTCGL